MSKSSFFKICPNLEGQLVVDGGHLGGHVDRSGGVHDEVLDRLVPVSLPARHQIENELEKEYWENCRFFPFSCRISK